MKKIRGMIKMVEKTDKKMKFECLFCKEGDPHMIVVMNKDGDIHVHAPFENKYLLNQMMSAIIKEQEEYNGKNV